MRRVSRLLGTLLSCATLLSAVACDDTTCRLCEAVLARNPATVRALLASGEPVTPYALETAVTRTDWVGARPPGPEDVEILELLIDRGDANTSWTVTSRGRASSVGSSRRCYFSAGVVEAGRQDPALVRRLLARGLDGRGAAGGEALHKAVAMGALDVARALIDAGAPVNHATTCGISATTPLHEAIQTRSLEMIALLEQAGAVEWAD